MISRLNKQIFIAVIFLLIISGLGFGAFKIAVPSKPTPTPNPTINLAPLQVLSQRLLNIKDDDYDFVAKIRNSNTDYGSGNVEYIVSLYDFSGNIISTKTGSFYIFPGQIKYVVVSPVMSGTAIDRAELKIKSVDWQQLGPLAINGANIVSRNIIFSQPSQAGVFAKVNGKVVNNSDVDFDTIDVSVIVFDANDEVVAVNKTNINTFLAKTERGFEVSWFSSFVGQSVRTEVEAFTNVFNNSNFIRNYGGSERFQQQY